MCELLGSVLRAGCGTTSVDRGLAATLFLSAEALIAVLLQSSLSPCAGSFAPRLQLAVRIFTCHQIAAHQSCGTDAQVISDARRIAGEPEDSAYLPLDPLEFCGRIFHTCYMGTENSSVETRKRAKDLSAAIGRSAYAHDQENCV